MKKLTLILPILIAAFGTSPAEAGTVSAVQTADGTPFAWRLIIGTNLSATTGWSFVVGSQDVELDALGIFDQGADGLEDAHRVGLWTNGGTLLASATVPSGTGGTLVGSYRYTSVAPLTLSAGQTYVLGAYFGPVADVCGSACGDAQLAFGTETFAPGITFVQSRQNVSRPGAGSLAFPNLDAEVAGAFFGPNFLLTAADPIVTPEPASMGIAGLALVALLAGAYRRNCF